MRWEVLLLAGALPVHHGPGRPHPRHALPRFEFLEMTAFEPVRLPQAAPRPGSVAWQESFLELPEGHQLKPHENTRLKNYTFEGTRPQKADRGFGGPDAGESLEALGYLNEGRLGKGTFGESWKVLDKADPEKRFKTVKFFIHCLDGPDAKKPCLHYRYLTHEDKQSTEEGGALALRANKLQHDAERECEMAGGKHGPSGPLSGVFTGREPNERLHVVRCLEAKVGGEGDDGNGPFYLVYEYAGMLLPEFVISRRDQLGLDQFLELERQLFTGIQFIAEQGYVHHDIKPENVAVQMEVQDGEHRPFLRIIDLGSMVKMPTAEEAQDHLKLLVGTPAFTPVEHLGFWFVHKGRSGFDAPYWSFDLYSGVTTMLALATRPSEELRFRVGERKDPFWTLYYPAIPRGRGPLKLLAHYEKVAREQSDPADKYLQGGAAEAVQNDKALMAKCTRRLYDTCIAKQHEHALIQKGKFAQGCGADEEGSCGKDCGTCWNGHKGEGNSAEVEKLEAACGEYCATAARMCPSNPALCGENMQEQVTTARLSLYHHVFPNRLEPQWQLKGQDAEDKFKQVLTDVFPRHHSWHPGETEPWPRDRVVHKDALKLLDAYVHHLEETGRLAVVRAILGGDPGLRPRPDEYLSLIGHHVAQPKAPAGCETPVDPLEVYYGVSGCTASFCACTQKVPPKYASSFAGTEARYATVRPGHKAHTKPRDAIAWAHMAVPNVERTERDGEELHVFTYTPLDSEEALGPPGEGSADQLTLQDKQEPDEVQEDKNGLLVAKVLFGCILGFAALAFTVVVAHTLGYLPKQKPKRAPAQTVAQLVRSARSSRASQSSERRRKTGTSQ